MIPVDELTLDTSFSATESVYESANVLSNPAHG